MQRGNEAGRRTRGSRRWNWRKSSTSTATWRGGGASKSPTRWPSASARSKFGSRTVAWRPRRRNSNRTLNQMRHPPAPTINWPLATPIIGRLSRRRPVFYRPAWLKPFFFHFANSKNIFISIQFIIFFFLVKRSSRQFLERKMPDSDFFFIFRRFQIIIARQSLRFSG